MPDIESEPLEHVDYSRPPVNDALAPHPFAESEFAPGCGRCDKCGGGPGAEIHQAPVDQMARIADALEEIAGALHRIEDRYRENSEGQTDTVYRKFMQERGL